MSSRGVRASRSGALEVNGAGDCAERKTADPTATVTVQTGELTPNYGYE
uniref:Uncharacterized protein n=1 Tax=Setaria digitata TaxID=48799 RepID=A0A915Q2P2_9BILA